jgi:hypothetical protein
MRLFGGTSRLKVAGIMLVVVAVSQLTIGTEPTPPPYHQYIVSGSITRNAGLPMDNFVVTLKGKFPYPFPDSLVAVLPFRAQSGNANYPAVTDTAGNFTIIVATEPRADSLVVEVTAAGKPTARGITMAVPEQRISITTSYTENEPGCNGCTSDATNRTRVVGYQYVLPEQTLSIPF